MLSRNRNSIRNRRIHRQKATSQFPGSAGDCPHRVCKARHPACWTSNPVRECFPPLAIGTVQQRGRPTAATVACREILGCDRRIPSSYGFPCSQACSRSLPVGTISTSPFEFATSAWLLCVISMRRTRFRSSHFLGILVGNQNAL